MRRLRSLLPTLVLLAFWSCGDSAIFLSPVEEPAEVKVETIAAGRVVLPGEAVPLGIARDPVFTGDPETADHLLVQLLDAEGVVLGEQTYESVDQADELPPLELPSVGEGLFFLRTAYYDGEELIEEDSVPFFISSDATRILGVSSFPATLYPHSAGLLSLSLDTSSATDPYLRWYLDDELVSEGLLSESGTTMQVRAPGESGAYTLRVDLFPVAPPQLEDPVPAATTYQTELLVSTEIALDQTSLAPQASYYTLYHFLGDTRDTGARMEMFEESPAPTRVFGEPELAVESDIFGYRVEQGEGFDLDGFILPVRDGRLSPFSVTMRLRPEGTSRAGSLLSIGISDSTVLSVAAHEDGRVAVELNSGTMSLITPGAVLQDGVTSLLTFSLVPVGDFAVAQLFVDGVTALSEVIPADTVRFDLPGPIEVNEDRWALLPGSAQIAGDGGISGIIDEFGVFFLDEGNHPSPDTGIYNSAMQQIYGEKLVYAEGFESDSLPDAIEVRGDARLETGRLVLETDASVLFPVFAFASEELRVSLTLEALPGSVIQFYEGESDLLVAELVPTGPEDNGDLAFTFVHNESGLLIDGPAFDEALFDLPDDMDFQGLRMVVRQAAEDPAEIAIESVVAWREYPEIPASLLEPEDQAETE